MAPRYGKEDGGVHGYVNQKVVKYKAVKVLTLTRIESITVEQPFEFLFLFGSQPGPLRSYRQQVGPKLILFGPFEARWVRPGALQWPGIPIDEHLPSTGKSKY